jgi:hypothetical protein
MRSPDVEQSRELLSAWELWSAGLTEIVAAKS